MCYYVIIVEVYSNYNERRLIMTDQNTDEINMRRLNSQLRAGIRSVLLSDSFKNFLETQARFYSNHYSFKNTLLIQQQINDPTYVMGAEEWKKYGRQVADDAKEALINIPIYPKEDSHYLDKIKYELRSMLMDDPGLMLAKKRLGASKIEITLQKNGIWGVESGGSGRRFSNETELDKFYWKNLNNKLPADYMIGKVYDVKDTFIPEFLWVKNNFSFHEAVLDDHGDLITNNKGEFKITNSAERISRFVESLDFEIPKNDEVKMNLLLTALKDVCKNNGISIEATDRGLIENGDKGCDGVCDFQNRRIQYANDLSLERRISVVAHEMAHVLMHSNLQRLSDVMGIDKKEIDHKLIEIQAEATAYLTANKFGIETGTSSFQYLATYSNSLALRQIEKSLEVIHKASKSMLNFIEKELIKSGYNLSLSPVSVTEMNEEQLRMYASRYLEDAVIQRSAEYADILKNLAGDYEKANDVEKDNIEDQVRCVSKINQAISETKELLRKLSNTDANEKADIIGIIERLDSLLSSIHRNETKFNYLVNEHMDILKENDNLVSLFSKDPMKALNRLENRYAELENLSKRETDYIALSKIILDDYSYLLRNERDTPNFVNAATQRAYYIDDMSSKNGVFVEINYMEHFDAYNRPALSRGELCHPKYADTVIREIEQSIRLLKGNAIENNEYFPYCRCDLTVFSPNPAGGLHALHASIDLGDKGQEGLTDFLEQRCNDGLRKEIFRAYENAQHDLISDFHTVPRITLSEEYNNLRASQSADRDARDTVPHKEKTQNELTHYELNTSERKNTAGSRKARMDISEGA